MQSDHRTEYSWLAEEVGAEGTETENPGSLKPHSDHRRRGEQELREARRQMRGRRRME